MTKPQVPIEIDNNGVWHTDGLPMLYVPRHFFMNNHFEINRAMGQDKYANILYKAGYKSAYHWCKHESKEQNLKEIDVFHYYLKRLSQRGWGRFSLEEDNPKVSFRVRVYNSAFVLHCKHFPEEQQKNINICFMFAGWFAGAADWVSNSKGAGIKHICQESFCAIEEKDYCLFEVKQQNND